MIETDDGGAELYEALQESVQPTVDTSPELLAAMVSEDPQGRFYTKALRGPRDVVLSGPIIGGWGPGRYHQSKALALRYLRLKFGDERVRVLPGWTRGRWAYLIKDLRKEPNAA